MSTPVPFPSATTNLLLKGPAGKLELAISIPENSREDAIAIICHPHPQQLGTMNNKVVTTLMRVYNKLGISAVRFNYRGVGQSQGSYGEGIGECEDLKAVWDWVAAHHPNAKIYLAGFSFGAYVSLRVSTDRTPHCLVSISPPVQYPWFEGFEKIGCPWLVVQGLEDDVVSPEAVQAFVKGIAKPPTLILMPETSHFFHHKLSDLMNNVENWLKSIDIG